MVKRIQQLTSAGLIVAARNSPQPLTELHHRVQHGLARQGIGKTAIDTRLQQSPLLLQGDTLSCQHTDTKHQHCRQRQQGRAHGPPRGRSHADRIGPAQQIEVGGHQYRRQRQGSLAPGNNHPRWQHRCQLRRLSTRQLDTALDLGQFKQALAQPQGKHARLQQHSLCGTVTDQPARVLRQWGGLHPQPGGWHRSRRHSGYRRNGLQTQAGVGKAHQPVIEQLPFNHRRTDTPVAAAGPHDNVQFIQILA